MNTILSRYGRRAIIYLSVFSLLAVSVFSIFSSMDYSVSALGGTPKDAVWGGPTQYDSNKAIITFAGGKGTATYPYLVSNGDQLYKAILENGLDGSGEPAYYKMTNDIYLNDIASGTFTNNWFGALGNKSGFEGHFDGNGFTVYGLYSQGNNEASALFPYIKEGSSISNLTVSDAKIKNSSWSAALVGGVKAGNGTAAQISGCGVTESVIIEQGGNGGAGIVSYVDSSKLTINNCYSLTKDIKNSQRIAGIVADSWWCELIINNCYSVGVMAIGRENCTCTNVYSTEDNSSVPGDKVNKISKDDITGAKAIKTFSSFDFDNTWKTTDSYPVIRKQGIWGGSSDIDTEWAGAGTPEAPYLIYTAAELYGAVLSHGNKDGVTLSFKLMNDVYLNDITIGDITKLTNRNNWLEDGQILDPFLGTFDGNYFTVYGLYAVLDSDNKPAALFPNLGNGAEIKNLTVSDSYIENAQYAGAVAGFNEGGNAVISSCGAEPSVTVKSKNNSAAGILGGSSKSAVINNCYSLANVSGGQYSGGIIGDLWGESVNINNSFCSGYSISGCDVGRGQDYTNCYTDSGSASRGVTVLTKDKMQGANSLSEMLLPSTVWTRTAYYPIHRIVLEKIDADVWDGSTDTEWEGEGTENSPYLVSSAAELYGMVKTYCSDTSDAPYFKLTADIYLNDVSDSSWYTQDGARAWYQPDFCYGTGLGFKGHLEGDGYTVYGLYYNTTVSGDMAHGLIPALSGNATVNNVGLKNIYIKSEHGVGGAVAGIINDGNVSITMCTVGKDVKIECKESGGLVGNMHDATATFKYCGAAANVSGTSKTAAVIAGGWGSTNLTITNSYCIGTPTTLNPTCDKTLYTTHNWPGDATNSFAESKMIGESAKTNMPLLDWDVFATTAKSYPEISLTVYDEGTVGQVWSGNKARNYAGGNGTKNNPYIIETGEQLFKMVSEHCVVADSEPDAYYELTADIYLNDISEQDWYDNEGVNSWLSTAFFDKGQGFAGHLEGNGHFIYGLYAKDVDSQVGLIPVLFGAGSVYNVHLRNSYLSGNGSAYIGGIAAYIQAGSTVTIAGCSVRDTYFGDAGTVGGIVAGVSNGSHTIDSCYFVGEFSVKTKYCGGIVGDSWATISITDCYSVGALIIDKSANTTGSNRYSNVSQESSYNANWIDITVLQSEDMMGENAKEKMSSFNWHNNSWLTVENDYPHILPITAIDGVEGEVWSGKKAVNYAGGNGTEEHPYIIKTAAQLYKMVFEHTVANDEEAWFVLEADIKLNDVTSPDWVAKKNLNSWLAVANVDDAFRGHFDGKGHVVSGLYVDNTVNFYRSALFPIIGKGATIENVGIINSSINLSTEVAESFGSAIASYVSLWTNGEAYDEADIPVISQCFADTTVSIKGVHVGGIVAGVSNPVIIKDCYFVGALKTSFNAGTMIGDVWSSDSSIINCYASSQQLDPFMSGSRGIGSEGAKNHTLINCYSFGSTNEGVTNLLLDNMRGEKAITNMKGFDFESIWMTVEGGTPVLRVFGENASAYSDKGTRTSSISFITNTEDVKVDTVTGVVGSKITLPTPERRGYKFDGWYVYSELQCPYTDNEMPFVDLTLYAKWSSDSIIQDFENYPNTYYDVGEDFVYYRPGVFGYNPNNVFGGSKSLYRKGLIAEEQDFLLNYEESLIPGTEYEMTFWMMTDTDGATGTVSLVNATWPDIDEPDDGVSKVVDYTNLKAGEWIKYTYKFTARTPWISIRTPGGAGLYFDDFMFVKTGNKFDIISNKADVLPATGDTQVPIKILVSVFAVSAVLLILGAKYLYDIKNIKIDMAEK